ncbi:MAG: hypothetical protein M3A44_12555 [Gammaproteobacteria bacterium]
MAVQNHGLVPEWHQDGMSSQVAPIEGVSSPRGIDVQLLAIKRYLTLLDGDDHEDTY